jgi:hypothetical protein
MDLFGGSKKKVSICDTNDERAAAIALGGKFLREDCGFFEKCAHRVEDYDFTVSPEGHVVELWYCQIDWTRAGPLMLAMGFAGFLMYRKYKTMQAAGAFDNLGRKQHQQHRQSYSSHHRRFYPFS